jgi:anti-sigma regulatory factor (Ser/Thr protein kinase)
VAGLSQESPQAADERPATGCAALAASFDWSRSAFGPKEQWEPAVAAVVRILLEASAPMAYCHGPGYAMVYNDSFADLLGARHPHSWGQRAALVMPEIWSRPGYAEAVDSVFAGGPSFHDDGEMLDLQGSHQSHPDWAYQARGYSAVRDSDNSVLGILVVVVEVAPVLVLVGGTDPGDQGAANWRGTELWDETVARQPLIWSGFRAGARSPEAAVSTPEQRFVTEGSGQRILPMNGPDVTGSLGYLGVPRHLPEVQMVTLAGRDQSDVGGTMVSGEFYDVFGLPDGRLAVTIGDVVGAGTAAAAIVAQVKGSLKGAALSSSNPSVILRTVDELVNHLDRSWPAVQGHDRDSSAADGAGFGGELFVTALFGVFDAATGDLTLASAGHFPPAVVRRATADDPASTSGAFAEYANVEPGPPLGISGARPLSHITLQRSDALVAFTDGLVERHGKGLAEGQSMLLRALTTMSATAARSISQEVVDTLIGDRGLEHDCALLVVVRDNRTHQTASVLVPPHAIAVRGARRWAQTQLASWGMGEQTVDNTVMCVSELVSNVVEHAGTSARVTMELADRLLVTVEDTGKWSAPRTGSENHSATQGRGLALVAALSDAMGHARGAEGSTVWFELVLDRAQEGP